MMRIKKIYEKFKQDTDPISDMQIGFEHDLKKRLKKLQDFSYVVDIKLSRSDPYKYACLEIKYWKSIKRKDFINIVYNTLGKDLFLNYHFMPSSLHTEIYMIIVKEEYTPVFRKLFDNRGKLITERFKEDSDPIHDLGIGNKIYIAANKIKNNSDNLLSVWESLHQLHLPNIQYMSSEKEKFDEFEYRIWEIYDDPGSFGIDKSSDFYINLTWAYHNLKDAWEIWKLEWDEVYDIYEEIYESLNEKFTEDDEDPIKTMGIGVRPVYYRTVGGPVPYNPKQEPYVLYITGDTFNIRDILKEYRFVWYDPLKGWNDTSHFTKQRILDFAPKVFEAIEKRPRYKVFRYVHVGNKDDKNQFIIPGWEETHIPDIPDGQGKNIIITKGGRWVEMIQMRGKGTYLAKDLLKYEGYTFDRNEYAWQNAESRCEKYLEGLINYLKERNYNIINKMSKKVKESLYEKFTEDGDPIADMDIGQRALIKRWFDSIRISPKKYTIDKDLNIHVEGYLDLGRTRITELPDNLRVEGNLDLGRTRITELPDNLRVEGNLDLGGTRITELPDNLKVGGSLYLRGTRITELPDNLKVGGSLYLRGTQITKLPDNLSVEGNLDLSGTRITELSDNLRVGGYLNLEETRITELPNNLKVGGKIYKDF